MRRQFVQKLKGKIKQKQKRFTQFFRRLPLVRFEKAMNQLNEFRNVSFVIYCVFFSFASKTKHIFHEFHPIEVFTYFVGKGDDCRRFSQKTIKSEEKMQS